MYNHIIYGYALKTFDNLKDMFTEEQRLAFFNEMKWVMDCELSEVEASKYWFDHNI